jgi:hypothetical protein
MPMVIYLFIYSVKHSENLFSALAESSCCRWVDDHDQSIKLQESLLSLLCAPPTTT